MTVYGEREARERALFIAYGHGAKNRELPFQLTFEQFTDLIYMPCHYCAVVGDPLNGVDRIDSSLGYLVSNCVPCCSICNRAKGAMPYAEFLEYLLRFSRIQQNLKSTAA